MTQARRSIQPNKAARFAETCTSWLGRETLARWPALMVTFWIEVACEGASIGWDSSPGVRSSAKCRRLDDRRGDRDAARQGTVGMAFAELGERSGIQMCRGVA
jgi:hypothetical protein